MKIWFYFYIKLTVNKVVHHSRLLLDLALKLFTTLIFLSKKFPFKEIKDSKRYIFLCMTRALLLKLLSKIKLNFKAWQ